MFWGYESRTGDHSTQEKSAYRNGMDGIDFMAVQSTKIDHSNLKIIKIIDSLSFLESCTFYFII